MMKIIEDLFSNMFDSKLINNERLVNYATDQLQRITDNNPLAVFVKLIDKTTITLNNMNTAMAAEGGNIGDRIGETSEKNQARKDFTEFIRKGEKLISFTFGETSTPYLQFFPFGLTPFSNATEGQYKALVENIMARATQYETELGTPFKDAAIEKGTAYINAKTEQIAETTDVGASQTAVANARIALTTQLTVNALTIAAEYPLDHTKIATYFNIHLLFAQHRKRIHKGEPAAGATEKVCKIDYEHGKEIKMVNTGATALIFQMHLQGNPVGEAFTVEHGKTVKKNMEDFFTNADSLYVTNTGTIIGKYEVDEIA